MSEQATAIAELEQKLQDAEARAIEAETKAAEAEARITELEGEITLRDEQITELQGRAEAAETANADLAKRIEAIEATLAEKTREAALGEKVNEILGQVHEEVIPLDGGGYATEHRAPTQEYAVVAASAFVKGDPDSVQALNVFLADNGGRIPTRNVSDKPNLQVIPASANAGGSAAPQTDDEKLAVALQGQEFTAQRGKQIKTLMDGGMPFEQARRKAMASS